MTAITAKVAEASGSGLVTASTLTASHDACSGAPWANGYPPAPGGAAFHRGSRRTRPSPRRSTARSGGDGYFAFVTRFAWKNGSTLVLKRSTMRLV